MRGNFETPPSRLGWRRQARAQVAARIRRSVATVVAIARSTLDRLCGPPGVLYLVPIAIAVWHGGRQAGFLMAALAVVCWLASFQESHGYSTSVYFFWEGGTMVITFAAFAELLQRLRLALARADYRFVRVLDELHACVYVDDPVSGDVLYANRSLLNAFTGGIPPRSGRDIESRLHAERRRCDFVDGHGRPGAGRLRDAGSRERPPLLRRPAIPWSGGRRRGCTCSGVSEQPRRSAFAASATRPPASARTVVLPSSRCPRPRDEQPLSRWPVHEASLRLHRRGAIPRAGCPLRPGEMPRPGGAGRPDPQPVADFVRRRGTLLVCDANDVIREAVDLAQVELENAASRWDWTSRPALPPL